MRYMDDMVVFGSNKRKLHKIRVAISQYLHDILGLELKDNYQVFNMEYVDKNGKIVHNTMKATHTEHNRVIMRKSIMLRMCRKARRIGAKEKATIHDCKQMMSALSWLKNTDTYGMYLKHIKPYINFQYLKRRISRYDKRQNRRISYGMV